MTAAMNTKIENLFTNPAFSAEVEELNSIEDLFGFLKKNDVTLTEADIEESANGAADLMIEAGYMDENGELSEEMLDMVAGGKGAGAIAVGAIFTALGIAYKASKAAAFASVLGSGFLTIGAVLIIAGVFAIGIGIVQSKLKKAGLMK